MPGPIIHLKTAYRFGLKHKVDCTEQLYLGRISPDSVNINGNAPKFIRWPAHLRAADLDEWISNAKVFYNENKGEVEESYLRGYIIHILTDIVWDRSFDRPLYMLLLRSGTDKEALKAERWNELYGFEREDAKRDWFQNDVKPTLSASVAHDIGTLKSCEVDILKDKIVSECLMTGKTPQFVDEKLIDELISEVILLAEEVFLLT